MTRPRLSIIARWTLSTGFALGSVAPSFAQETDAPPANPYAASDDEAFLLTEPTTPEGYFRAVVLSQRLGRPVLARRYLDGFLASNPDDELLLRLRDEYGPAVFSRLSTQKELQPASTQLADRAAEVFRRRGADPQRIGTLIDQLSGPANEAFAAREALINAGDAVIPEILRRLTQADDAESSRLLDVLAGMGETALPALHAALDAPDEGLKVQVLSVISRIGSRRSVAHLYFPAYGPDQPVAVRSAARDALTEIARVSRLASDATDPADVAARLADEAVAQLSAPATDGTADAGSNAVVWSWDASAGTVRSVEARGREAALIAGRRFAHQAFRLAPSRRETQALYLAFLLGAEASSATPEQSRGTAFNTALAAGPDAAVEILRQSLLYGIPRAGAGALAVLAKTASPSLLYGDDTVLGDALNSSDPRVQFAAAEAVLSLNPDRPFRHSRRVVEILARALADTPEPTAVIIDPSVQRGSTMSGFVRDLGYEVAYARSGQQGFATATRDVQPTFILVNLNVSQWPLSQTLSNLRADARTRDVPVIVYGPAPADWLEKPVAGSSRSTLLNGPGGTNDPRSAVRRYLSQVPGTTYVAETTTTSAFAAQVRPALSKLVSDPLTPSERVETRAVAAYRLAQIADTGKVNLFPLHAAQPALTRALSDPEIAENALIALSAIPTEEAQAAIAQFVLTPTEKANVRAVAAGHLADHVRRFGILLPKATVVDLYRVWDAEGDPELRSALAAWGGTLRPGTERVRQQLEVAPPTSPLPAKQP